MRFEAEMLKQRQEMIDEQAVHETEKVKEEVDAATAQHIPEPE